MDTIASVRVFDRMSALGDTARSRMIVLLEGELTVSELVSILQLPQSTVSRHLRVLADDGWVTSRTSGTSRFYRLNADLDPEAEELWHLVRSDVVASGMTGEDRERARAVRAARRERSRAFFASTAGEWDSVRSQLFGRDTETLPLLGLLDPKWTVGDLGAGTGVFSELIAPYVEQVIAVDASAEMLESAGHRLARRRNVGLRLGELESLPIESETLDLATMLLVLHYVVDPGAVLAEAARALKPGGLLTVVDMRAHGREAYQEEMGHLWPGFLEEELESWIGSAGLEDYRYASLSPRLGATGPLLFMATARRPD
jgi:ubiquinone/menaquinone biosynthesis C-methylase UbiE/DNA-binding transcriptional ArsR family regulator